MNLKIRRAGAAGLLATAAAALMALPAGAAVVIDQPLQLGSIQVLAFSPVGQSFTAVTPSLDSIGVYLDNFNVVLPEWLADHTVTLRLYDQAGLTGNLLGQSTVDAAAILGNSVRASGMIDFDLGSVSLVTGQSYSFAVVAATARWGVATSAGTNAYAGGQAYFTSPVAGFPAAADTDLVFRVSAVPEPAAAWMLIAGLATVAGCRRLRTRRSPAMLEG